MLRLLMTAVVSALMLLGTRFNPPAHAPPSSGNAAQQTRETLETATDLYIQRCIANSQAVRLLLQVSAILQAVMQLQGTISLQGECRLTAGLKGPLVGTLM